MSPKNLNSLIRWMFCSYPQVVANTQGIFVTAYRWKYQKQDDPVIRLAFAGYLDNGVIPSWVEEFVRIELYPHFIVPKLLLEVK